MITKPHYHLATGKSSKNKGKLYPCKVKRANPFGCCITPAWDKDFNLIQC